MPTSIKIPSAEEFWSGLFDVRVGGEHYGVGFMYRANAPTLCQCCHNVGANIVSTSVPVLWQRSSVDTFKCPSNVVWMSRQHCVNVVATLYFDQNPNVATTLSQHCGQCWPTFRQCCVTVVAASLPNIGKWHWDNIQATLGEHCGNVTLNVGDWHWENVQARLC